MKELIISKTATFLFGEQSKRKSTFLCHVCYFKYKFTIIVWNHMLKVQELIILSLGWVQHFPFIEVLNYPLLLPAGFRVSVIIFGSSLLSLHYFALFVCWLLYYYFYDKDCEDFESIIIYMRSNKDDFIWKIKHKQSMIFNHNDVLFFPIV